MPKTISCKCLKVEITVTYDEPTYCLECACEDCFQAAAWAEGQGGPKAPRDEVLLAAFYPNDLTVEKGQQYLQSYMQRADSAWILGKGVNGSVRVVATCCYSTLIVDHPFYGGLYICTFPAMRAEKPSPVEKPRHRHSVQDWPKQFGEIPPYKGEGPVIQSHVIRDEQGKPGPLEDVRGRS
eukprot:NODE_15370_length_1053_cov_8.800216.p2 GENE.NODE_15370_length_1053_cov_8.800216~~NODE_15370_length_1053_cov_8.800216.p2  ORF type:complete len:181 (-),score=32.14 NODE_15370_length_1053_cov_8.800216:392-934(-)